VITTLKNDGRRGAEDDRRMVEIRLLGEILNAGPHRWRFQRGVSSHPALDSPIHTASREELCAIYARPEAPTVRLGTLKHASDLPAFAITDNLLGKHFAVLGTTGAGKSCAVTVILRAILDAHPYGHVIMLDPHNEYRCGFADRAELLDPSNLKLPYWLLNFEEISAVLVNQESPAQAYAEGAILRSAIVQARRAYVGSGTPHEHVTVDTPVPYRLSDLIRIINEAMGAFNKAENSAPYQHLMNRIEAVSTDKRYEFMFSRLTVHDTMGQVLSRILRIPVQGKPITIIDISGVPSEIVDVVVSVLCRLIFEFALWSDRAKAPPILLVCEEAHRYVPRDDQAGFAPTKRSISRIAKEGRKYGLSLCLVTQRPAELSVSSLSQCNTIFALRLSNDSDLEFARNAVPDSSRWLVEALPALNTQEALVLGDGVSVPMHIRFNDLAPEHRPASTRPPFSQAWQQEGPVGDLIAETIERWRYQIRGPADAA
jgi:DNA helicase HerA-like ATPase